MGIKSRIDMIRKAIIILYIFFAGILLLSIGFEVFCKESFVSWISELSCPSFLKAHVIFEIIKIIGFSNVFLGWFYSKLDQKMIGLTYSDILNGIFPHHHLFTIIHLLCNILCIAVSSASLSESALISFAMVLNGFVYQWLPLYYIVLNSKCCENLAEYIWKTDVERRKSTEIVKSLFCLSCNFCDKNSKHYDKHLECFCSLLIEYIKNDTEIKDLKSISEIWANLSKSQGSNSILIDVLENIFNNTDEINDIELKKHIVCEIISAYMVSKMYFTSKSIEKNCVQKNFSKLIEEMWSLKHFISIKTMSENKEVYDEFSNCIQTNIYVLAWMFFQYRLLQLTKDMVGFLPAKISDKYIEKMAYTLFLPIVKEQESIELAFKVAMSQLNKDF